MTRMPVGSPMMHMAGFTGRPFSTSMRRRTPMQPTSSS
jgi:hypothetical protein